LPEPVASNGHARGSGRQGEALGRGVDNGRDDSATLGAATSGYHHDRGEDQDDDLYGASPLLAPVSTAATQPPRVELPPRVVSIGGGLKSRFTEVLESTVALSLPHQPPTAEPRAAATHASATQQSNPQSDVAVAVSRTVPSTTPGTKLSQPLGSTEEATASATQLLARKAAKKVVLAQEAEEAPPSHQDVPRLNSPKKVEVDGRGSPSRSRKTTDTSVSNFPISGMFPRAFRS